MLNETARSAFLKLLQDAAATNVQLLLASKETNADPKNPQLKAKLEARARDVVESMKKLLQASNVLQGQLKSLPHSKSSGQLQSPTSPTAPGAVAAPAANPAVTQLKSPGMRRKDSFDDFIVHRSGSKASGAPDDSHERDHTLLRLDEVAKEIDAAQKNLLASRARPRQLSVDTKSSNGTSLLDSTLLIVQSAYHLATLAKERFRELSIIGSSGSGDISQEAKDTLSSTAKAFSAAITELVARSTGISSGSEE